MDKFKNFTAQELQLYSISSLKLQIKWHEQDRDLYSTILEQQANNIERLKDFKYFPTCGANIDPKAPLKSLEIMASMLKNTLIKHDHALSMLNQLKTELKKRKPPS